MRQVTERFIPWFAALAIGLAATAGAVAQGGNEADDASIRQMQLTDQHLKNFVSAQPDLASVASKLQEAGDEIAPALQTELDELAKKHGFTNFEELDDVAANISLVMAGLDAKSGEFTEPQEALKKELADITADTSIPEDDKKQLIEELNEAIANTPKLEHQGNVDVVKAHRDEIEKALQ